MPSSESIDDPVAYWNGPAGERWAREQATLDRAFAAFTSRLFEVARLAPGERVLDVGCGAGTTTLAAADAVGGSGAVFGVDVSAPMVARAKAQSGDRANVRYALGDAATERWTETFDAAISRFGVMFFPAPGLAFANLRKALRPGARMVFVCWRAARENDWVRIPYEHAVRHVTPGPSPGPEDPGPFSFGPRDRVARILAEGGFTNVAIDPFDADAVVSVTGLAGAVDFALENGPTGRLLRGAADDAKARVRDALMTAMAPLAPRDHVTLRGATWIVTAFAPR